MRTERIEKSFEWDYEVEPDGHIPEWIGGKVRFTATFTKEWDEHAGPCTYLDSIEIDEVEVCDQDGGEVCVDDEIIEDWVRSRQDEVEL